MQIIDPNECKIARGEALECGRKSNMSEKSVECTTYAQPASSFH